MPYQEVGEGVIVFACEGNLIKMSGNYHFETGVRCDVNNAFTDTTALCFANNNAAVFDLNSTTQSNYRKEYQQAHESYVKAYELGRSKYIQGQAGIYIENEVSQNDLRNIIIDIIYPDIGG